MAGYEGMILTKEGMRLQAQAQIGGQLIITKLAIGDGMLQEDQSIEELTALVGPLKTLGIQDAAVIGDGTSRIRALVTNEQLTAGFFVREIGVYAKIGTEGEEKLYAYTNAGDKADWLPVPAVTAVEEIIEVFIVIGNAQDVTAIINDRVTLATKLDLSEHNADPEAHKGLLGAMPVGGIMIFPAAELPEGFMPCDGTYLSRTAYKDLFDVIGTRYGEGDGINTFNLPDLRGEFVRGWDDGKGIDAGRELGSIQGDAQRPIVGTFGNLLWNDEILFQTKATAGRVHLTGVDYQFPSTTEFNSAEVTPTANENRPRNVAMVYAIKVFGAPVNTGEVDVSELAQSVAELTNTLQQPAGSVLAFAGNTPPSGYLVANGAAVGRETYPDLFAAIGTTFGEGNGTTTFNLPDLRGEFLRGADLGRGVDEGREIGSWQKGTAQVGDYVKAGVDVVGNYNGVDASIDTFRNNFGMDKPTASDGYDNVYIAYLGLGAARKEALDMFSVCRPRNVAVLYCIKAFGSKTNVGQIDLTALANDVNKLSNKIQSTFIYPNGGTAENPANITINTRYVMDNPFPGYQVKCIAQVYHNGQWGETGWVIDEKFNPPETNGCRANFQHYKNENRSEIVLQVGSLYVMTNVSIYAGNGFGIRESIGSKSLPCRIYVEKGGLLE